MSALGLLLVIVGCVCAVLAIAYQLDAYEARYQQRLKEQVDKWEAGQRGSARVRDFKDWQEKNKEDAA